MQSLQAQASTTDCHLLTYSNLRWEMLAEILNTYFYTVLTSFVEFVYISLPDSLSKVEKWWLGYLVLTGIVTKVFWWLRLENDILKARLKAEINKELQFINDYIFMLFLKLSL